MLIDKFTFQTDFLFYKKHTKCTLNLRSLDFPSADSSREENSNSFYGRPFVSKLWHDIRAVFSHVYLQSFLLHDIRAFFCHVYVCFIPKYMTIFLQTRIYMRTKNPIYMRYKQACGIWGYRKSSYKRHRIIPSVKNPFMYDRARFGSYSLPSQ